MRSVRCGLPRMRLINRVACPAGYWNPGGDDTAGSATQCDLCDAGYRVDASHNCVACPAGYWNHGGDDTVGSATQCDLCDADYRVDASHNCVACPVGYWNAAGTTRLAQQRSAICARRATAWMRLTTAWRVLLDTGILAATTRLAQQRSATCAPRTSADGLGNCVECAPEFRNAAGDDTAGNATQCDLCDYLYRADGSGNCVACPDGYADASLCRQKWQRNAVQSMRA